MKKTDTQELNFSIFSVNQKMVLEKVSVSGRKGEGGFSFFHSKSLPIEVTPVEL